MIVIGIVAANEDDLKPAIPGSVITTQEQYIFGTD